MNSERVRTRTPSGDPGPCGRRGRPARRPARSASKPNTGSGVDEAHRASSTHAGFPPSSRREILRAWRHPLCTLRASREREAAARRSAAAHTQASPVPPTLCLQPAGGGGMIAIAARAPLAWSRFETRAASRHQASTLKYENAPSLLVSTSRHHHGTPSADRRARTRASSGACARVGDRWPPGLPSRHRVIEQSFSPRRRSGRAGSTGFGFGFARCDR
ncbi:hypothetical protein BC628DRAFT_586922 [Trametes gibbosa]|nr:hypothetical protein BC628DRAFT_586922 [Trametes gibbosa]